MLKKPTHNYKEGDGSDVPADNPTGTMRRFGDGLKKIMAAPKPPVLKLKKRKR